MKLSVRLLALAFALMPALMAAQVATGTYAFGTYDNKRLDTINLGNLNVHFSLPVLNKAGRGIPFSYNLSYDSSVWYPATANGVTSWTQTQDFGWTGNTQNSTGYLGHTTVESEIKIPTGRGGIVLTYYCWTYANWVYNDAYGVAHPFPSGVETMKCTGGVADIPTANGTATDGSGYTLSLTNETTGTITTPAGHTFNPPNDPNGSGTSFDNSGNYISTDGNGHFTDTTGNVVLTVAGTAPNPQTFTYTDTHGSPQAVTVTYKAYTIQTNFQCGPTGPTEYGPLPGYLVDTITYPDSSVTYKFSYEKTPNFPANVTGRLIGIELPQGDTISYSYPNDAHYGVECADGSASGLTRTLSSDSGSAASVFSYSRTSPHGANTSHTEVVDGLNNDLNYDFVEPSNLATGIGALYYETNRNVYEGPETGTAFVARQTCYNGSASPCTTTLPTLPFTEIAATETLNGLFTHEVISHFNSGTGTESSQMIFDFASAPNVGSQLRSEWWGYNSTFPGLPVTDQVLDGGSNLSGKTTYGYDAT
jgi:hypothetical protein